MALQSGYQDLTPVKEEAIDSGDVYANSCYQELLDGFSKMIQVGGPEPEQYSLLDNWFANVHALLSTNRLSREQLLALWDIGGDVCSANTLQGFSIRKPRGYAGDFEIIDKVHTNWISPMPHLAKWDKYFQNQAAAQAVRNRKAYLLRLLSEVEEKQGQLSVLNVASGPCRDLLEYFVSRPSSELTVTCVELDQDAIDYAKQLCSSHLEQLEFVSANALRYRPPQQAYDLVWCAGLFDYLSDKAFKMVLQRLLSSVHPGGELVIGNFSPDNPNRAFMEFAEWFLNHRSEEELKALALACGIPESTISVGREPLGVNLFLHIRVI